MKKIYLLTVLTSLLFISCSVEDTQFNDKIQNNSELSVVFKAVTIDFKTNTTQIDKNILKEDLNVLNTIQISSQKEVWVLQTNYTNEVLTDIIMFSDFVEQIKIENNSVAREGENTGGDKSDDGEEDESNQEKTGGDKSDDGEEDESNQEKTGGDKSDDGEEDESNQEKTGGDKSDDGEEDTSNQERIG